MGFQVFDRRNSQVICKHVHTGAVIDGTMFIYKKNVNYRVTCLRPCQKTNHSMELLVLKSRSLYWILRKKV
jgi:hypothetical protein